MRRSGLPVSKRRLRRGQGGGVLRCSHRMSVAVQGSLDGGPVILFAGSVAIHQMDNHQGALEPGSQGADDGEDHDEGL